MWTHIRILLVCACAVTAQLDEINVDLSLDLDEINSIWNDVEPYGPLDDIIQKINETIEAIKPNLTLLQVGHFPFNTGPQEFGNLVGSLDNLNVTGLDELVATIIQLSIIPLGIKNLTVEIGTIDIKGDYEFDGNLSFPLGEGDIHFFGDGILDLQLLNAVLSVKVVFTYKDNKYLQIKTLDIHLTFGDVKAHLTNLMGGGDYEDIFNDLINDVALTVINYYKDPLLIGLNPIIIKAANDILDDIPIKIGGGGGSKGKLEL